MKKYKKQSGFTLAEMLVTVTVFSVVFVVVSGIFVSGNKLQQKTANLQRLQNDGRYVLEKLAREIRAREIKYPFASSLSESIEFEKDEQGDIVGASFDEASGNLLYTLNGVSAAINGEDVEVVDAKFFVFPIIEDQWGSVPVTQDQGRVTILLKLRNRTAGPEYQQELTLQTTISSKVYKR